MRKTLDPIRVPSLLRVIGVAAAMASFVGLDRPASATVDSWLIQLDNDQLIGRDRYYSSGIHFGLAGSFEGLGLLPRLRDAMFVRDELRLSHGIYTPDALSVRGVQDWDHPYNGTLLLRWVRDTRRQGKRLQTALQLGVMGGAAGAGEVQNGAHDLFPAAGTVRGWPQVVNSEAAAQASLLYEFPLRESEVHPLAYRVRFRGGSLMNDVYSGVAWTHRPSASWSYFGGVGSSLVAYDGILQGGPLRGDSSPHVFDAFRIRRLRGHAELGANWFRPRATWTLSYVGHSATFKGGLAHGWATLRLTKPIGDQAPQ